MCNPPRCDKFVSTFREAQNSKTGGIRMNEKKLDAAARAALMVKKQSAQYAGADRIHNRNILMNNRMGLRIEFDIDLGNLEIWVNPKAGKSLSYRDVNFSCRDDFTKVFDSITLPTLNPTEFLRCDYDPFHSVLYFQNQTLHVLSPIDQPVIVVFFEQADVVDIKTDKADGPIARTQDHFETIHPDRGYAFVFGALLTNGSTYRHQICTDQGRSAYARGTLAPASMLFISASLQEDSLQEDALANAVRTLSKSEFGTLAAQNLKKVEEAANSGILQLPHDPKFEHLLELNKRILISAQNESGAIQAAFKRIYYLLWIRDGGMIWSLCSYAGMTWPLQSWVDFVLANPTQAPLNGNPGVMFGQMINPHITKWQEDGAFYVVWSAFTHWTQTGSRHFLDGARLAVLNASINWLEAYCFEEKMGLFGRYFMCETPLTGARDFGWDNATAKPTFQSPTTYHGKVTKRSHDIYINAYMHSVYMMMFAMESEAGLPSDALEKANRLEAAMAPMFEGFEPLPSYGYVEYEDDTTELVEPIGLDVCDYQWGLSLAPFLGNPLQNYKIRNAVCQKMTEDVKGLFVAGYASVLSGLDTEFIDEQIVIDALDCAAQQSYRPGDYLCMPNTIVEILDVKDGDMFHDVRPQGFSISAMLAATANLGVRKLPFGLAVRATKQLKGIKNYEYLGKKINFEFTGTGKIAGIEINGRPLERSWVIPQDAVTAPQNTVSVTLSDSAQAQNTLIYASVQVLSVGPDGIDLKAFGKNQLLFKGLNQPVSILANGEEVATKVTVEGAYTMVEFAGVGRVRCVLK
ncbi:MAG: hypothetical protein WCL54_03330 [Clostridia bacterium]